MQPEPSLRSGRQLALRMQQEFPQQDWIDALVRSSGWDRDTVEWHLQEDMAPPRPIHEAAMRLLDQKHGAGDAPVGDVAPDELPFTGLPGNLGELRAD